MTDYSGLIVPLPELEPLVGAWRARYDTTFADVPAHVTALFPWIPPDELTEADLDAVGQLAKGWQPFEVCFERFASFDDAEVHYLAPEPADPFLALTEDLCAGWPEYPPYEGAFAELVPHLTVSTSAGAEQVAEFRAAIAARLPVRATARELVAVEVRDGRCRIRRSFRLGGGKG
ncbi:MAG: 2'-5' RNA ligase family protein [Jatrophihabitantaceae bacterium]